jgi:hypothetical protein
LGRSTILGKLGLWRLKYVELVEFLRILKRAPINLSVFEKIKSVILLHIPTIIPLIFATILPLYFGDV